MVGNSHTGAWAIKTAIRLNNQLVTNANRRATAQLLTNRKMAVVSPSCIFVRMGCSPDVVAWLESKGVYTKEDLLLVGDLRRAGADPQMRQA